MAVGAICLDESHRRGHPAEQLVVDDDRSRSRRSRRRLCRNRLDRRWRLWRRRCNGSEGLGRRDRWRGWRRGRRAAVPVVLGEQLDESSEPRKRGEDGVVTALEERAPCRVDRFGILEVLLEQRADVAGIEVGLQRRGSHSYLCTSAGVLFLAAAPGSRAETPA